MSTTAADEMAILSRTVAAKSDQINADDLVSGPIVVQILEISMGSEEQPVNIHISGHMPWRPCKTDRRLLLAVYNGRPMSGTWIRLERDDSVRFGKEEVGGIRFVASSILDRPFTKALQTSRGKRKLFTIAPLTPPAESTRAAAPQALLDAWKYLATRIGTLDPPLSPALTGDEKKILYRSFGDGSGVIERLTAMDDPTFARHVATAAGRA